MAFVVTLRTAVQGDVHRIGRRAMDLVILFEKNIQIPLSFIITADALRAVYAKNDLGNLLSKAEPQEYEDILLRCTLPDDLTEELEEGYESLAIKDDISASRLMSSSDMVDVLLIPSPTKATNELSGIMHALQGKDDFLQQVKKAWAHLLRTQGGSLDAGIVVQRMIHEDVAGIAVIGHDDDIAIKTHYGLQNFHEAAQCDEFEVSKSLLSIQHAEIAHQDAKLVREEEGIEEYPLKDRGSHQKASDKEVIEIARIAKRAQSFLHKDLVAYMGFKRLRLYFLFCDDAPVEDVTEEAASEAVMVEKGKPAEIEITLGETIGKGIAEEKKIDLVVADEAFTYEAPQTPVHEETRPEESKIIAYDSELEKPLAEQETDDFMLSMPVAHLVQEEVMANPVQEKVKAQPADILNTSRLELNRLVTNAEAALKEALIDVLDLNKVSRPSEDSVLALAVQAKQVAEINTEDVSKIAAIAKRAKEEHVSLEELMFVIDTCERMVRELE